MLGIERSAALPTGLSGPLLALAFRDQPPVRDATAFVAAAHQAAVEKVRTALSELGWGNPDVIDSPILGAEGNREFLLYARRGGSE